MEVLDAARIRDTITCVANGSERPLDAPEPPEARDVRATGSESRPRRYTFPRRLRISSTREFQHILDHGGRATDSRLTLWAAPNGRDHPRLGLVVGRKHGNAPRRNRLKRLLREAFRLLQHELPGGWDFVASPRGGAELDLADCQESLRRLATRLTRERSTARRRQAPGDENPPAPGKMPP